MDTVKIANLKGSERAKEVAFMINEMPPFKQGVALGILAMIQNGINPPAEQAETKTAV